MSNLVLHSSILKVDHYTDHFVTLQKHSEEIFQYLQLLNIQNMLQSLAQEHLGYYKLYLSRLIMTIEQERARQLVKRNIPQKTYFKVQGFIIYYIKYRF